MLSNLSFGVYLIHILVMRYWLWQQEWILNISNYLFQTISIASLTLMVSIVLCLVIAKSPVGDYLIGYRIKKK